MNTGKDIILNKPTSLSAANKATSNVAKGTNNRTAIKLTPNNKILLKRLNLELSSATRLGQINSSPANRPIKKTKLYILSSV